VLAALLIRMALAETFSVKCGIMALDEPTTNLDTENIKALAQNLSDIIEKRQNQSNFQLLVITHDEGFIQEMKIRGHATYFHRLSRDRDNLSVISKVAVESIE